MDNIIIVGTNITREFPILSIYLRNAQKTKPTNVYSISTYEFAENFSLDKSFVMSSLDIEKFFNNSGTQPSISIDKSKNNLVIIGPAISYLSNYSNILKNVSNFAKSMNSKLALLGDQANTSGAWAMGIVPHRLPGGVNAEISEKNENELISDTDELLIIYNLEPEYDFSDDNLIIEKLKNSKFNIFFSSYITESISKYADIVFPLATQVESSGSYLNTNKNLQYFNRVIYPLGESKEGKEILLELHKSLGKNIDIEDVRKDVKSILTDIKVSDNYIHIKDLQSSSNEQKIEKIIIRNPNSSNPTLRRCDSLLNTHDPESYLSIPFDKTIPDDEKITFNEKNNKLKLGITQKRHNKPENVILVNVGGTHKQKIGAYSTEVEFLIMDIIFYIVNTVLTILYVVIPLFLIVAYVTYSERKIIGFMQSRMGPTRVGPAGLLQPIADVLKLVSKEIIIPTNANKGIFLTAPMLMLVPSLLVWSVIPLSEYFIISNINAGLLFILALTSLSVYGVILAGWASNSKYAFLGSMRSAAQIIAYEIAMGFALVGVLMLSGSLNLQVIIQEQSGSIFTWYWIPLFPLFLIYFIAGVAETNRAPFDVSEGESEIVAGFHVEYSGMAFAMFFLAEYMNLILISILSSIMFFGGLAITFPRNISRLIFVIYSRIRMAFSKNYNIYFHISMAESNTPKIQV